MTTPSEPTDSFSSFEQQLKQLKPVPATGLEEMLYQAGWQAGRVAALATSTPLEGNGQLIVETPRRGSWTGFICGAASGLVAASLLFVIAARSNWLPNSEPSGVTAPNDRVTGTSITSELKSEPLIATRPANDSLAASEQEGSASSFDLLEWFNFGAEAISQNTIAPRSQMLTAAPLQGANLDRFLSDSARLPSSRIDDSTNSNDFNRRESEILRYQPLRNSQPAFRF